MGVILWVLILICVWDYVGVDCDRLLFFNDWVNVGEIVEIFND